MTNIMHKKIVVGPGELSGFSRYGPLGSEVFLSSSQTELELGSGDDELPSGRKTSQHKFV